MFWKGFASAFAVMAAVLGIVIFLQDGDRSRLPPPPPGLQPPPFQQPGAGEGASQAQPGEPTPPSSPFPPRDRDPNQNPDQTGPSDDEDPWDLDAFARRHLRALWDSMPADKWQLLTNGLLVLAAFLQWSIYRRQARIMDETREIAFAGLDRPQLFFEFVSHNFEEWREGKANFWFNYRFLNYGNSPAIVQRIETRAILSNGPYMDREKILESVETFPTERQISCREYLEASSVYTLKDELNGKSALVNWENSRCSDDNSAFIILPKRPSRLFGTPISTGSPKAPGRGFEELRALFYETTGPNGWTQPWLLGRVEYGDLSGRRHRVNFCIRGQSDGTATQQPGPPYNERT